MASPATRQEDIAMHSLLPIEATSTLPSKSKPLLQHFQEFRTTRFFVWLTIITAVMFIINIVQISLMDHLNSRLWILGFPAIVFVLIVSALLVWMFHTRRSLLRSWHEAGRATHVARVGIVLSVLLPVFCCEFLYLNLVAVPAHQHKIWTTSLQAPPELHAPSLILFQRSFSAQLDVKPGCPDAKSPCFEPTQKANTTSFQDIEFNLYDAAKHPHNISTSDGPLLSFSVVYNEPNTTSTDRLETNPIDLLLFGVFDPRLTNDLSRAIDCGIVTLNTYPVNQSTAVVLYLDQVTVVDNVGGIELPKVTSNLTTVVESCDAISFSDYNSYNYQMLELGGPPTIDTCTRPLAPGNGPCNFQIGMLMSSMLVTTQTSKRGTSWIQMLLDEGSIVGGITFVTWFLGIYVI